MKKISVLLEVYFSKLQETCVHACVLVCVCLFVWCIFMCVLCVCVRTHTRFPNFRGPKQKRFTYLRPRSEIKVWSILDLVLTLSLYPYGIYITELMKTVGMGIVKLVFTNSRTCSCV